MSKTRIHDLAAEFRIPTDQLLRLLAEMDIHVRSHLSALDGGQVALVRARWEREKRQRAEPATTTRRRRATKKATRAKPTVAEKSGDARPKRRRRTAAEVEAKAEEMAAEEAKRAEEIAATMPPPQPLMEPTEVKRSIEERAAALFGAAEESQGTGEPVTAEIEAITEAIAPTVSAEGPERPVAAPEAPGKPLAE